MLENFSMDNVWVRALISLALFICLLVLRLVTLKLIRLSKQADFDVKRRWSLNTSSILSILFFVTMVLIWRNEIQTFALSFFAIAVALAIATKELIMCFSGTFYKISSNPFGIGDRIEVKGIRGDVIDRGPLMTKILEIGPGQDTHQHTGRCITLPNSLFLSNFVVNESYFHDYVLHTFSIPIECSQDWNRALEVILKAADEECSQYLESAQKYIKRIQYRDNLELPMVNPRVHVKTVAPNRLELLTRIAVPARSKGKIEQKIIRKFLERFYGPSPSPNSSQTT